MLVAAAHCTLHMLQVSHTLVAAALCASHIARLVKLVCLDYATGKVKWSERGLGCGSLMMADGKLIVLSDKGELLIAPATPTEFKPTGRMKAVDGKCWTVPVLSHNKIYCRTAKGELAAVDVSKD